MTRVGFPDGELVVPDAIDFALRSADQLLRSEFGRAIGDVGVQVGDPFTGSAAVVCRLLLSDLIDPETIVAKYRAELHLEVADAALVAPTTAAVQETLRRHVGVSTPFTGVHVAGVLPAAAPESRPDGPALLIGNPVPPGSQRADADATHLGALEEGAARLEGGGVVAVATAGARVGQAMSNWLRRRLAPRVTSLYVYHLPAVGSSRHPQHTGSAVSLLVVDPVG